MPVGEDSEVRSCRRRRRSQRSARNLVWRIRLFRRTTAATAAMRHGRGLRLSDAAADCNRPAGLDGDGSLKEALADVVANGTQDEIERLTNRIGAAQAAYTARRRCVVTAAPGRSGRTRLHRRTQRAGACSVCANGARRDRQWQRSSPTFSRSRCSCRQSQKQLGGGTHWQPAEAGRRALSTRAAKAGGTRANGDAGAGAPRRSASAPASGVRAAGARAEALWALGV